MFCDLEVDLDLFNGLFGVDLVLLFVELFGFGSWFCWFSCWSCCV